MILIVLLYFHGWNAKHVVMSKQSSVHFFLARSLLLESISERLPNKFVFDQYTLDSEHWRVVLQLYKPALFVVTVEGDPRSDPRQLATPLQHSPFINESREELPPGTIRYPNLFLCLSLLFIETFLPGTSILHRHSARTLYAILSNEIGGSISLLNVAGTDIESPRVHSLFWGKEPYSEEWLTDWLADFFTAALITPSLPHLAYSYFKRWLNGKASCLPVCISSPDKGSPHSFSRGLRSIFFISYCWALTVLPTVLPNCYQAFSALPDIELESIPFLLEPVTMLHTGKPRKTWAGLPEWKRDRKISFYLLPLVDRDVSLLLLSS